MKLSQSHIQKISKYSSEIYMTAVYDVYGDNNINFTDNVADYFLDVCNEITQIKHGYISVDGWYHKIRITNEEKFIYFLLTLEI